VRRLSIGHVDLAQRAAAHKAHHERGLGGGAARGVARRCRGVDGDRARFDRVALRQATARGALDAAALAAVTGPVTWLDDDDATAETFGVYVHVPFCAHRCDYCAFATYADRDHLMEEYVTAVIQEIAWARDDGLPVATSVFFGGGTPSRLSAEQLLRILEAIPRTDDAEVTVECNPEDASIERLRAYRAGGVNRMSFGVQSTQPAVLADLGRRHGTMAHEEVSRNVTEGVSPRGTWTSSLARAPNRSRTSHTRWRICSASKVHRRTSVATC